MILQTDFICKHYFLPLPKLRKENSIGKSLTTNPDALKHSITLKLFQHQWSYNLAGLQGMQNPHTVPQVKISPQQTFFSWLGMIQRTKLGLVARSVSINLLNCSFKIKQTID